MVSLLDEMVAICRGARGPIPGIESNDCKRTDVEVLEKYLCIHFPHKVRDKTSHSLTRPECISIDNEVIAWV